MGVRKKLSVILAVFSLIVSACGGGETSVTPVVEETSTTTSTTSTTLPGEVGEVGDEAALVVPPILLKPLIGATGILTSTGTEYAFDQLLGKTGTRTQTQTAPQKTKKDTKVITANPKNNKGIILPPEGKKKNKITSFALNPAKVSK